MFPKSIIFTIVGIVISVGLPAEGGDWMFRRSWFSHGAALSHESPTSELSYRINSLHPSELPDSRSAYRPAIPQRGPGFSIRSKNRYNFYRLQSGRSFDTTIYREFSFEESP